MTEEQIKKKADKYLKAYTDRSIHITKDRLLQLMIREAFIDGYHEGFKDCAKSRLNVTTISDYPIKVDWHYVKDGGTPTKEGHYLVCLRNKDHDIFDCWIFVSDKVSYSLKVRMKDIIAWKEIVLPELKESE